MTVKQPEPMLKPQKDRPILVKPTVKPVLPIHASSNTAEATLAPHGVAL